jgi:transglutaminase-like putative cysteine protease
LDYQISHTTTYTYDRPIVLLPHTIRLRPRCDVMQSVRQFSLEVTPKPSQLSEAIDLDGNAVLKVWFSDEPTSCFRVQSGFHVSTHCANPFNYLLEPWALHLPFDYPASLLAQLQPYLGGAGAYSTALDPVAVQLAQDIALATHGHVPGFLSELNQQIYQTCQHYIRETGDPLPPGVTWNSKAGSCRDMALLFMEACRSVGLATRFVSGYQEGDPDWEHRHLHAWIEVYLPGAGWRGYDPTQGTAVADRHIALVASSNSRYTTPVSGSIKGVAQAKMDYHITILLQSQSIK